MTEAAALAPRIAKCIETIAQAIVPHPELQWEQQAQDLLPRLCAAQGLIDRAKRLQDIADIQ